MPDVFDQIHAQAQGDVFDQIHAAATSGENVPQPHRAVSMNPVDYVLENLYRSREEVIAHPELFEPEALERIDKAIVHCQEVKGGAKAA